MRKPAPIKGLILLSVAVLLGISAIYGKEGPYKKISSNGLDVYYRLFGEGIPILIIGGGPGDVSDRYLGLCDVLAKDFRCILVDQRGTGRSAPAVVDPSTVSVALTIDDFEAIRVQLGLKHWAVLGFSYGGFLASIYTSDYPASVSSLILLGSMGFDLNVFSHFADNIRSRLWASDLELLEYWSDPARAKSDPGHALVETIRAKMPGYFYDRKKSLIVSQTMKDSDFNFEVGDLIWKDILKRKIDLTKVKSAYDGPVLVLHGRQDPLGESVPQMLSRYYKNSRLVFIEKCGHYSWIEQPEMVYSSIKAFLFTAGRQTELNSKGKAVR